MIIFNDHGNVMFLDRLPTFALGVAERYEPVDEGWGPRDIPDFEGAQDFSWFLADKMVERHFDPMIRPRDRGRSRATGANGTFLWAPKRGVAREGGPDLGQYVAVPDPHATALLGTGQGSARSN